MYDQMDRRRKAVFQFDNGLTACTGIIADYLCCWEITHHFQLSSI